MKSLINEKVSHNKFGIGKIMEHTSLNVKVFFPQTDQAKFFQYPNAFEKFLTLENETLNEECQQMAVSKREEKEKAVQDRLEEMIRVEEEEKERNKPVRKKRVVSVKVVKEKVVKEKVVKEKVVKEKAVRVKAVKEKAIKEEGVKEEAVKEEVPLE